MAPITASAAMSLCSVLSPNTIPADAQLLQAIRKEAIAERLIVSMGDRTEIPVLDAMLTWGIFEDGPQPTTPLLRELGVPEF